MVLFFIKYVAIIYFGYCATLGNMSKVFIILSLVGLSRICIRADITSIFLLRALVMDAVSLPSQPPLSNGFSTPSALSFPQDDGLLTKYMTQTQQTPVFQRGASRDLFGDMDFSSMSKKASSVYDGMGEDDCLNQSIACLNHVSNLKAQSDSCHFNFASFQEVMSLGMPSLYDGEQVSLTKLVNAANKLLLRNQGSLREKEDLETK